MSKKNKTLSDIQAALRSNTKFLGEETNSEDKQHEANEQNGEFCVRIEESLMEDLILLAQVQNTAVEKLVHLAIEDLLSLRERQLRVAKELKAKKGE